MQSYQIYTDRVKVLLPSYEPIDERLTRGAIENFHGKEEGKESDSDDNLVKTFDAAPPTQLGDSSNVMSLLSGSTLASDIYNFSQSFFNVDGRMGSTRTASIEGKRIVALKSVFVLTTLLPR